MAVLPIL
jgi:hypothetical protein